MVMWMMKSSERGVGEGEKEIKSERVGEIERVKESDCLSD